MKKIITSLMLVMVLAFTFNVSVASANTQALSITQFLNILKHLDLITPMQFDLISLLATLEDSPSYKDNDPMIDVTYPMGREMFEFGDKIKIQWDSNNLPENTVRISLYNGYDTYYVESDIENDGSHSIELPRVSGEMKVSVESGEGSSKVSDSSEGFFHIFQVLPEIELTYEDVSSDYEDSFTDVDDDKVGVYKINMNLLNRGHLDIKTWEIDYTCNSNIDKIEDDEGTSCVAPDYFDYEDDSFSRIVYIYRVTPKKAIVDVKVKAYDVENPSWTIKRDELKYPVLTREMKLESIME